MKILIEVYKDGLWFSLFEKNMPQNNLNNTNIIDVKNMVFDSEYINKNSELVNAFLNTVVLKNNLKSIYINKNAIAIIVLKMIHNIENINSIYFLENKTICYDIGCHLFNAYSINYLNCYSMPAFLFDRLNLLNNMSIELRSEVIYQSYFMSNNNLFTYSQIYYKKIIYIDSEIINEELEDLDVFLRLNDKLKIIELRYYSVSLIKTLIELLVKNNILKIKIVIVQNENDTVVLNNCVNFIKNNYGKFIKKQFINIKIKYSAIYKSKMVLKQVNLSLIRAILVIVLSIFLIMFLIIKNEERKTKNSINEINNIASELKEDVIQEPLVEVIEVQENEETNIELKEEVVNPYYTKYEKIFSKLLSINNDTVGWLTINNTDIDYPIVQYKDNDFYLNNDFYKRKNAMGWVFLDYRINVKDLNDNNIIYGHDTTSDLMFGSLKKVLNKSWYTNPSNQIITFNTIYQNMKWQIFSIYTIKVTNDYLISNFQSKENYTTFLEREKKRSIYDFGIEIDSDDKILTLSTCYKDSTQRLVIHAKLIK